MIIVQHLTKSTPDKILFEDISFKIADGQKVGLVGPNGVGKTTLLTIIAGLEDPDRGEVITTQEVIGYLPQKLLAAPNQDIRSYLQGLLPESWQIYMIDQVLAEVGLAEINQKTLISKLSGGQKMRVGLAALLLKEPTALLLDEPTNNLDVKSLQWLENFVQHFPGKVLVVSHDRYFLDRCVQKIIELDPYTHKVGEYGGNYTAYVEQKQHRQSNLLDSFERQQAAEKHMREWIVQKQEQLKFHPSNKVARQLQAMKTRFKREFEDNKIDKPKTYKSFSIDRMGEQLHQKKAVVSVYNFHIHQLLDVAELHLYGKDRVKLMGENGAGKTTFIKSILGEYQFFSGTIELGPQVKLGYFSQEHELLDMNESVMSVFAARTGITSESEIRKILGAFLFTKVKVFSLVKYLSEGEKARLLIAIVIYQQNDFLFLDEPTNHLDLESREVLATALQNYEGGFLVVSHDRYFLEQIGINRVLTIKNRTIK